MAQFIHCLDKLQHCATRGNEISSCYLLRYVVLFICGRSYFIYIVGGGMTENNELKDVWNDIIMA